MNDKDQNENLESDDERVEAPESEGTEKKFTQKEIDAIVQREKRKMQARIDALSNDLKSYQDKETERETQLKARVDELKKNAPAEIIELIEYAPLEKQIELLEKQANTEKPKLPSTPKGAGEAKERRSFEVW